jgi:antitoxin (DNA-binding transcriptional repressor) of toxin-antitoxin stability system
VRFYAAALQVATKHVSERRKENDALETRLSRVTAGFMKTYTYSTARQRLAEVLEEASREGEVQIRRQDGRVYAVTPVAKSAESPFANVTGRPVKGVTSKDPLGAVRQEGWARGVNDGQTGGTPHSTRAVSRHNVICSVPH